MQDLEVVMSELGLIQMNLYDTTCNVVEHVSHMCSLFIYIKTFVGGWCVFCFLFYTLVLGTMVKSGGHIGSFPS